MTEDRLELTRRKVLASMGAVGAAGAGAGLGTTALFSDEESLDGNTIAAGELDLKVDWEEHYSFPQIYGFDDPTAGLDVTRSEPGDAGDYVGLPDPNAPQVWVHEDDLDAYMAATSIEAYPDPDGDGQQEPFGEGDVRSACLDGADLATDLDPSGGFRTSNPDTWTESEEPAPLVALDDVKPGDFGELTLSIHLCDNPGYVWMQGDLAEAAENGTTEPEADSDDAGPADEVVTELGQGDDVELLDDIQTTLWYDGDCDNVLDAGGSESAGEEADVVIVLDRSGSMSSGDIAQAESGAESLIDALGANDQVGFVSFSSGTGDNTNASSLDAGLTTNHQSVKNVLDGSAGGSTNMEAAIERAHEELSTGDTFAEYGESGNARSGVRKIMVFLGDGAENEGTDVTDADNDTPSQEAANARADGIEVFSIAYGNPGTTAENTLAGLASDPSSNPESQYFFEADVDDVVDVFEGIGGTVSSGGEEVIERGTLRELLERLSDGDGILLDSDRETEETTCFPAGQTHCVGLSWWLPTGVGNGVQSDAVSFDVGFYTEQCRNNGVGTSAPQ